MKKQNDNIVMIHQRRSNIEREFQLTLEHLNNSNAIFDNVSINASLEYEKERDLSLICKGKMKIDQLVCILNDNIVENRHSYHFYTDGSLKQIDKELIMAIGWI